MEYFFSVETALCIGRVISNILFILMAFTNTQFIMIIFVIFAIIYATSAIMLQVSMQKCTEIK